MTTVRRLEQIRYATSQHGGLAAGQAKKGKSRSTVYDMGSLSSKT